MINTFVCGCGFFLWIRFLFMPLGKAFVFLRTFEKALFLVGWQIMAIYACKRTNILDKNTTMLDIHFLDVLSPFSWLQNQHPKGTDIDYLQFLLLLFRAFGWNEQIRQETLCPRRVSAVLDKDQSNPFDMLNETYFVVWFTLVYLLFIAFTFQNIAYILY